MKAHQEQEISVRIPNNSDQLADVIAALLRRRVRIATCGSYHDQEEAVMLLTTDHPRAALTALRGIGCDCATRSVVVVGVDRYEPMLVGEILAQLEYEGIRVQRFHPAAGGSHSVSLVFDTTDDARAVRLLRRDLLAFAA